MPCMRPRGPVATMKDGKDTVMGKGCKQNNILSNKRMCIGGNIPEGIPLPLVT